jgi:hypothetical protein
MAEKSKFGGLAELRNPQEQPSTPALPERRTKPVGKRSDPDWRQFSHMMRIETHDMVLKKLRTQNQRAENPLDFSDLIEMLAAQWAKE